MLHPEKARVVASPVRAAAAARRQLAALSQPSGSFDASRYFRGADNLGFLNVGTQAVRQLARELVRNNNEWEIQDALAFANQLISDRYLEVKGCGIERLACYRAELRQGLLRVKPMPGKGLSTDLAPTRLILWSPVCPLLLAHPRLARQMLTWSRDRNMWVRRA